MAVKLLNQEGNVIKKELNLKLTRNNDMQKHNDFQENEIKK